MELGSGSGMIASMLIKNQLPIHLSDASPEKREDLRKLFAGIDQVRMIHDMDFYSLDFPNQYSGSMGAFSTVIAVNVFEHGYYDNKMLKNAMHLLRARGHLILVAPTTTALYFGLEDGLSEWKQYNGSAIEQVIGGNIEILKLRFFSWSPLPTQQKRPEYGLSTLAVVRKL